MSKKQFIRILLIPLLTVGLVLIFNLLSEPVKLAVHARDNVRVSRLPSEFVGVWEGHGIQDNGSEWSILLTLIPGSNDSIVGTIAYPSLKCGGKLTLQSLTDNYIELFENLIFGTGGCVNRGTIELQTVSNRRLKYQWFYANGSHGADGVIRKISAN